MDFYDIRDGAFLSAVVFFVAALYYSYRYIRFRQSDEKMAFARTEMAFTLTGLLFAFPIMVGLLMVIIFTHEVLAQTWFLGLVVGAIALIVLLYILAYRVYQRYGNQILRSRAALFALCVYFFHAILWSIVGVLRAA